MTSTKSLIVSSVSSPLALRVESGPVPEAGPGTAVVEILASLIGPAHGFILSRPNPHFAFPTPSIFGNNAVGRVVSTGPDSVTLRKGQLMFVDSYVEARDDPEVAILLGLMDGGSEKSKKLANDAWRNGTWTTHAVVPLENANPLDETALLGKLGYDITELVYLTRWSVAYGGMSTINVKVGETVIVGPATGHFGGAAVEVASASGARVIALGRNTEVLSRLKATIPRVETVVRSGDIDKDTDTIRAFGPADAFVDFTPTVAKNVTHISSAVRALRRRGKVAFMSGTSEDVPIPYWLVMLNSIEINGRWMYSHNELRELIKMVENGVLKLGKSVGHEVNGKFSLEDWDVALDAASKHTAWGKQFGIDSEVL
ncbi:hypothetical protein DL762_007680 [Monosporascus cannonballus]|uniref:Alcohol dehydrogenase-like C-terminal domain-containing protein n=1 Tax=Monosporascus cannonballus TaxID=155416 RepID=A0ABY0GZA8_9PEZI|nr:hypothetical protein DL762_007680 [Monosporascus cannonballus]